MHNTQKCVVPFSGGMDSTVLLYSAQKQYSSVYPISFIYGQRHLKEIDFAKKQAEKLKLPHKIVDLSFFRELVPTSSLTSDSIEVAKAKDVMGDPQTVNYVPFRNMMLLSICAAYAESVGASTVYHGAAQADSVAGYWDGSPEFLEKINNLVNLNRRHKIAIKAPLIKLSKQEIIQKGWLDGVDFKDTWTCYEGKDIACGTCTACSLRLQGFIQAKLIDPVKYAIDIDWYKYGCESMVLKFQYPV